MCGQPLTTSSKSWGPAKMSTPNVPGRLPLPHHSAMRTSLVSRVGEACTTKYSPLNCCLSNVSFFHSSIAGILIHVHSQQVTYYSWFSTLLTWVQISIDGLVILTEKITKSDRLSQMGLGQVSWVGVKWIIWSHALFIIWLYHPEMNVFSSKKRRERECLDHFVWVMGRERGLIETKTVEW